MWMVIDDPEDPKQVAKKLLYHFKKARTSTRAYAQNHIQNLYKYDVV